MQIIADLQLHSRYSRATSQKMELSEIARWAKIKGISLMATGDWTHPLWFKSIKDSLKETSQGTYQLKDNSSTTRFLLSTEISSIYTQGGKQRRVHNLIFSPSIETSEKIIAELKSRGCNLMSDGRPIVGLSSKEILELVMEIDDNCLLIPAHAWTPWFSIFGSKSGFDSIEECFGKEGAKYIYAVETGLSSDPIMNWQIDDLNNRSLVSFSDAHSGPKLGREATVFILKDKSLEIRNSKFEITYDDIANAIRQDVRGRLKIGYTIEFFPEEGKYHWSGHRACNIRYNPQEVRTKGVICPVCHQPLTIGVENRVMDLSSHTLTNKDLLFLKNTADLTFVYDKEKKRRPFVSLIPLLEILAEINNGSTVKAEREYQRLTSVLGPEFEILMKLPYEEIEKTGGPALAQSIKIIRNRQASVDPGYDGVFGVVKIHGEKTTPPFGEISSEQKQPTLF